MFRMPSQKLIDELYGAPPSGGDKKLSDFKKKEIPKPETKYSGYSELFEKLDIDGQYNARYESLNKSNIIEKLSNNAKGITGIDGKEYPVPTIDQVKAKITENEAKLMPKIEQGFTKILLVPFAMPLNDLMKKYEETILKHHKQGTLRATNGDTLELNENMPLYHWDGYNNADKEGNIVYYPKQFNQNNHQGQTKQELLDSDMLINGWRIMLIEDLPDLPAEGQGEEINGRKQLEANRAPIDYLQTMQADPIYQNEQGLTPEDYIAYAISQLEEKDQVIDDWQGNGKSCWMAGAYFPASGLVPYGRWFRYFRQAYLYGSDPGLRYSNFAVRSGVNVL